jgi:hypothetical protein
MKLSLQPTVAPTEASTNDVSALGPKNETTKASGHWRFLAIMIGKAVLLVIGVVTVSQLIIVRHELSSAQHGLEQAHLQLLDTDASTDNNSTRPQLLDKDASTVDNSTHGENHDLLRKVQATDVREKEEKGTTEAITDVDEKHLERKMQYCPAITSVGKGQRLEPLVTLADPICTTSTAALHTVVPKSFRSFTTSLARHGSSSVFARPSREFCMVILVAGVKYAWEIPIMSEPEIALVQQRLLVQQDGWKQRVLLSPTGSRGNIERHCKESRTLSQMGTM